MAKPLNTLTEAQLIARIDEAKARAESALRNNDTKAHDRYLSKAAKLGRILAEVRTTPFFFGGGSEVAAPHTAAQHNAAHLPSAGTALEHNADLTGAVEVAPEPDDEPEPVAVPRVHPGPSDTTMEALALTRPWARGLRKLCLKFLLNHGPSTPDEVAAKLGKSPLAIRPRFSELHTFGAIKDTGDRRNTVGSGKRQIVWAAL